MNLYLLRHADAEVASSTGKDADRALSAKGRETMKVVGAAFARVAEPAEIFHSPLRRARETAEFVAAQLPGASLTEVPWLTPESDPRIAFDEIRARRGDLLWVGHQPHLGRTLGYAVTGTEEAEIPMKKASIARISFSGTHPSPPGTLKWIISPGLAQRIR
jgi:phosphohistidine phosphatase SixA